MKVTAFALIATVAAAPLPAPQFDIGALLGGLGGAGGAGGLDIGKLLGGLGGAAPAGGAAAGGGLGGLASLIPPGLDLGALASSFLGGGASGPTGDVSVIIGSYNAVRDKVLAMDALVEKIDKNTDFAKVQPELTKLTKDLLDTLADQTKKVEGMAGAIDVMSALGLQGPGDEVTGATKTSNQHLVDKKDLFKGEFRKQELENLEALLKATEKYSGAVQAKLPSFVQSIAAPSSQQSNDAISAAIGVFKVAK
jgi:hypothetical protein